MRVKTLLVLIGLGLMMAPGAARAAETRLSTAQIEKAVSGNSASFYTDNLDLVKAYFAPDGVLRGRIRGGKFEGTWSVSDDTLCIDLPGGRDDACRRVFRRDDSGLRLYTLAGEPAGELTVAQGDLNGF